MSNKSSLWILDHLVRLLAITVLATSVGCAAGPSDEGPPFDDNYTTDGGTDNSKDGGNNNSGCDQAVPSGPYCQCEWTDAMCTGLSCSCDPACWQDNVDCLIEPDGNGGGTTNDSTLSNCDSISCWENDVESTIYCDVSDCEKPPEEPPEEPPVEDPNPCPDEPDGGWGSKYECYAIDTSNGDVYWLDKEKGLTTATGCTVPANLGPIEAIAAHPATGEFYFVSQDQYKFGKFLPDAVPDCRFEVMGDFPSVMVGGFAFHPTTHVLYAGDEDNGDLYTFGKDANGNPMLPANKVMTLPNASEGLAIKPGTDWAYNIDGNTLTVTDLTSGQEVFPALNISGTIETIFFDKDGRLFGINKDGGGGSTGPHQFVEITLDPGGKPTGTQPIGDGVHPELEGSECNTGCAYDTYM